MTFIWFIGFFKGLTTAAPGLSNIYFLPSSAFGFNSLLPEVDLLAEQVDLLCIQWIGIIKVHFEPMRNPLDIDVMLPIPECG